MKKLLTLLLLNISILSLAWAQDENGEYKEYGIVLILPGKYYFDAQKINKELAAQMPEAFVLPNIFHITLFQGRFSESEISKLYSDLKKRNFKKIRIKLEPEIKSAEGCYINWQVQNSEELQNLHQEVVRIANNYRHGMLSRYADSYSQLSTKQQREVEQYGMTSVLDEYNPHVTLFYFPQKNSDIDVLITKITPPAFVEDSEGAKASMAIAELGYNGNIEKILYGF